MGSLGAMQKGSADRYFQDADDRTPTSSCRRRRRPRALQGQRRCAIIHQLIGGVRASMGYTGCAHHRRDAHQGRVRRDHLAPACANRTCTTCRSPRKRRTTASSKRIAGEAGMRRFSPTSMHKILILDFGAQYTQLIARRVREARRLLRDPSRTTSTTSSCATSAPTRRHPLRQPRVGLRGRRPPRAPQAVFELGVPVLGICYGMQTMAQQLGGKVEAGKVREFGYAEVRARGHTQLLDGIEDSPHAEGHGMLKVWMSHGDKVAEHAAGLQADGLAPTPARSPAWPTRRARFYGVQFHPEVTHTLQGTAHAARASCTRSAAAAATGTCRTTSPKPSTQIRDAGRHRRSDPRPVGRRRFVGGRGADPQARSATSSPACSSTTACCA